MRNIQAILPVLLVAAAACRTPEDVDDTPALCQSEDAFAPNSSFARSAALGDLTAAPFSEAGLFLCRGDEDWFHFDASAGQIAEISLAYAQADGDLQLELLNDIGMPVATSAASTGVELVRHTFLEDGTWYVRVYGATSSTSNAYDLDVSLAGEPCGPDALEPNDGAAQAAPLTSGAWEDLTVCFGEDDWYELDAGDGQVVVADAAFDFAAAEISMALYRRADDGTLAWVAGSAANETGEQLVYRITGEGPFLLQVVRGADTVNAVYDLDLSISGDVCEPDPHEPNDGYYGATPVVSGDAFEGVTLCVGDRDWYTLEVASGQLIDARLDFVHADGDLGLQVYKLNGDGTLTLRATSDDFTDDERVLYRPFDSGTFLLHAYPTRGTVLGVYDFSVQLVGDACVRDDLEPNDAAGAAAAIETGSHADLSLCVGDDDWYTVELKNGQVLDAKASFDHDASDLGLAVYKRNADGTIASRGTSDTLSDNEQVLHRAYEDGTFLVRVYRSRGTEVATYALDIAISGAACAADVEEPNDGYPDATPITPGAHAGKTLCVGDTDWYAVEAKNGQLLHVDIDFEHAQSDLGLQIYKRNDDGTLTSRASSDTLTDDETIDYLPYDDGTFLIQVYRSRGTQLASYAMNVAVSGTPCTRDAFEPNDEATEAAAVSSQPYPGQTLCVADADWYRIDLKNGQLLRASLDFSHAQGDLGLIVYKLNDDGTITSRASVNTLTDDEVLDYRPYDDGTFLIYVYRAAGGTKGIPYDLDVRVTGTPCVPDDTEPNDTFFEAKPLSPGSYTGRTLCVGDADWFSLELGNGQLFTANLTFTHAQNDLGIQIYRLNEDGTLTSRASADSLTDDEYLIYRPYDTGTFLFQVYRSRGTSTATYALDLQVTGSPCVDDDFEPNNHWLQAAALPLATDHAGLTSCVADDDYYDLGTLAQGRKITAVASFTHAENDFGMAIYAVNPNGTITTVTNPDSVTDDETAIYTVNATHAGKQFVLRVYRSRSTPVGTYDLRVDIP